jgi:hypothetical protein
MYIFLCQMVTTGIDNEHSFDTRRHSKTFPVQQARGLQAIVAGPSHDRASDTLA